MRAGYRLRQELHLECTVCDRPLHAAEAADADTAIALFGLAEDPYAVCPACRREVGMEARAREPYRLRVRRHYFSRGIVLHQDASGRWLKRSIK